MSLSRDRENELMRARPAALGGVVTGVAGGVVLALTASLLLTDGPARADEPGAAPAAPVASARPGAGADVVAIARDHLARDAAEHGLTPADVAGLRVSSVAPASGFTVVYLQQRVDGIDVADAIVNVTVADSGEVVHVGSSGVRAAATRVDVGAPAITDVQAARSAARALDLVPTESFRSADRAAGADRARELGDGGVSTDPIPAELVYQRTPAGDLRLAWRLVISPEDGEHWWDTRVDATTGRELERQDWVSHADGTYEVFPLPAEAPTSTAPAGTRQVLTDPYDAVASPYGWLDVDGVAGADRTSTDGNNVHAYTDLDGDDVADPGSEADGGAALDFRFPLALAQDPAAYRDASVTNLFYLNNRIHDVLYHYGFDEASGNFQVHNHGRGGVGGDPVRAEVQDGSRLNNANFATPPDGQPPRMQMYVWDYASPARDSSLDAGIVVHEYAHGVSNRLTGGAAAPGCLENDEQAGEGWSDFFAYTLTTPPGTTSEPPSGRGIATYLLGQPAGGRGLRSQRYSRDPWINDMSYEDIARARDADGGANPHAVGEVWGQALWQVLWNLVDEHGYDPDLIGGDGGNNLALQLVMDGLKIQPCSPGFVDARDAVLAADEIATGGAHRCLLWRSFAVTGLGFSAQQGSSFRIGDGIAAYDLPPDCEGLRLTTSTTPAVPVPGGTLTYRMDLENTSTAPMTAVDLVGTYDPDASYVAGSATCGGSHDVGSREVAFTKATLAPGEVLSCTYAVTVAPGAWSRSAFADDFEGGLGRWTTRHVVHPVPPAVAARGGEYLAADWGLADGPDGRAARALAPSAGSDQWLTTAAPVRVPASGADLVFDHRNELEPADSILPRAFDGGQVLVSDDGGTTWEQPRFTVGGPEHSMMVGDDPDWDTPIAGEPAFSGTGAGWVRSVADLDPYAGRSVLIAFRTITDYHLGGPGWSIDNVFVGTPVDLDHQVLFAADPVGGWIETGTSRVLVAPAPDATTVTGSRALSASTAEVSFLAADSVAPVEGYDVRCSGPDGATGAGTGAASPLVATGLTPGHTYSCEVRARSVGGDGPWSPPGPTFVVTSAPGGVAVTGVAPRSATSVRVDFSGGDANGSPITSYDVQCSSGNGGRAASGSATTSPVILVGLTAGRSYACRVRAVSAVGEGAWGAASSPYLQAVAPGAPRVRKVKVKGKVVTLTLAPGVDGGSPVTRYAVTCRPSGKGRPRSVVGTTPVLKVRGLTVGRTYRCRGTQTTAAGTSPLGPASTKVRIVKPGKGRR